MSIRVDWSLGADSSWQLMGMEQLLFAMLFTIADGKKALECLESAFKCHEWKWDITFTPVH